MAGFEVLTQTGRGHDCLCRQAPNLLQLKLKLHTEDPKLAAAPPKPPRTQAYTGEIKAQQELLVVDTSLRQGQHRLEQAGS